MEKIELTLQEFEAIKTNETGTVAEIGLVLKKPSFDEKGSPIWVMLTYGDSDKDGNYDIDIKQIIIKAK